MDRERRLIDTLIELADTLVADYDPVEFLSSLSARLVELLGSSAAGVLLGPERSELVAASNEQMRALELLELRHRQGPCYDAYTSGEPVNEPELGRCTDRWPEFAPQAYEVGYRSVTAQPLIVRGDRLGALNVFRDTAGPFKQEDLQVARGIADMAALGVAHERTLADADAQIAQLKVALDSRAVLEHAKAVLADRTGVDHGTAFLRLRRYARDHNERLADVARRFVEGDLSERALPPEDRGN